MSENLRNFTRAVYGMDAVVQRVPEAAWDNPSPCEGWSARNVLAHQIGVLRGATETIASGEMKRVAQPEELPDPVSEWNKTRDGVLAALDQKGALNQEGEFWFGPMSIDQFISVVQWDPLTHGWDIAKATGVEPSLDPELAQRSYDTIAPMRANLAKRNLVAEAEVEVSAGADIVDRYLGLVGRDPNWTAA